MHAVPTTAIAGSDRAFCLRAENLVCSAASDTKQGPEASRVQRLPVSLISCIVGSSLPSASMTFLVPMGQIQAVVN